jgi:hypothetical protein
MHDVKVKRKFFLICFTADKVVKPLGTAFDGRHSGILSEAVRRQAW